MPGPKGCLLQGLHLREVWLDVHYPQFRCVEAGDQATGELGEMKTLRSMRTVFDQMELIIDNLLNREEEPEDAILAASAVLEQLEKLQWN